MFFWSLELEIWGFIGIWDLEPGIYVIPPATQVCASDSLP